MATSFLISEALESHCDMTESRARGKGGENITKIKKIKKNNQSTIPWNRAGAFSPKRDGQAAGGDNLPRQRFRRQHVGQLMLTGVRSQDHDCNSALWVISDSGGGGLDTLHARDRRGKKRLLEPRRVLQTLPCLHRKDKFGDSSTVSVRSYGCRPGH